MLVRDRQSFGAIDPVDAGRVVNDRVAVMVRINDALFRALQDFESSIFSTDKERIRWEVENWHTNALKWMDSADQAVTDQKIFTGWRAWGMRISSSADDIAKRMSNATVGSYVYDFAVHFPSALATVATRAGTGAARVVGSVVNVAAEEAGGATKKLGAGVGVTLLYVGGAAALVLLLATMGGRSINLGPFKIGGGR